MPVEPVSGDGARPLKPVAGATPPAKAAASVSPPLSSQPADLLRTLSEVLSAGEVVSARVVQPLGGDQYQLALRGRTVIAQSAQPLLPDSVVRVQLVAGGAQPTLRLLDAFAAPPPPADAPAERVQALGLPLVPASLAAVAAFAEVGAPLDPARLRHAVEQSAPLPPAEAATRLRALALIARADLPATPTMISLAGHAVTQGGERALPNPAAAVIALRQVAQLAPAVAAAAAPAGTVALEPDLATTVTAPAVTVAQAPTSDPRNPPGAAPPPADRPAGAPAPPLAADVAGSPAPAGTRPPPAGAVPAGVPVPLPLPVPLPPPPQAAVAVGVVQQPPPELPPAAVVASPALPVAGQSVPSAPPPPAMATGPLPAGPPALPSPAPVAGEEVATVVGGPPPVPAGAPRAPLPMPASPAVLLRDLLTEPLPDLALGGVEAAKRALSLAGVRPRPAAGEERAAAASRPSTLAQRVAALPLTDQPGSPPAANPLSEPAARLGRELAAEAVFKSDDLADYDRVLALPVTVQGQPVPARLAVAERRTTGGTATFVRVDTELSALGEVSVRLSGVEGGSLAITMLAGGAAGGALADGLPALVEALRGLGIVAAVRVVDPQLGDHA